MTSRKTLKCWLEDLVFQQQQDYFFALTTFSSALHGVQLFKGRLA